MKQIDASYTKLIDNHVVATNTMADISVAFQRTSRVEEGKQYVDTINQLGLSASNGVRYEMV